MARGWESKAVEGQVQEFESKENRAHKRQLTQAQVEIRRQREILQRSRARVRSSCNPPRTRAIANSLLAHWPILTHSFPSSKKPIKPHAGHLILMSLVLPRQAAHQSCGRAGSESSMNTTPT